MDPPPLPPYPTIPPTMTPATIMTATINPESTNSSPRSHQNDTWDESLPPVLGAKIRLMCSYGGHIIPSPYDKSLCYIGGDTRIVVVDRLSSLSELRSRLAQSLLNGRPFALKYQLPSEDLDSLVSVTNDEDLENMIDEYDKMNSASQLRPSRLRLFLFPSRPETAASMGRLLDDAKSETWFADALNDSGLLLPRGFSDSAAVENLVELDHPEMNRDSSADVEHQDDRLDADDELILIKTVHPLQSPPADTHTTLSDSPMPETNSSFDSSHSSPSMSNLPPIKVRDEQSNQQVLFYEQFSGMNVGSNVQKHEDGSISMATALPPRPRFPKGVVPMPMAAEAANAAVMASQRPPLPLQLVQPKAGDAHAGGYNLPSPDSVASDSSTMSCASLTKYAVYPEANPTANTENQLSDAAMETQKNIPPTSSHVQYQPIQESMAPFLQHQNQQQLMQPTLHYIQHPPTNPQMPSYYPMYVPSPSQEFHQTLDQQYQTYLLQAPQAQKYHLSDLTAQPNIPENSTTPPPNQSTIPSSTIYNEIRPPLYPGKPTNYYRVTTTPTLINVPSAQFQHQYFNNTQMQQSPAQPAVPANSSTAGYGYGYGYEYANQLNEHAYYGQHLTTPIAQYQTMAAPAATAMYTQNATNSASETIGQQQAGNLQ